MYFKLYISFLLLPGFSFGMVSETQAFPSLGMEELRFSNWGGNLNVSACDSGDTTVVTTKEHFAEKCVLEMKRVGATLHVEVQDRSWLKNAKCRAAFQICLPSKTALRVESHSGDLQIRGMRGNVDFRVGTGNVLLDLESQKVSGLSASGNITLIGSVENTYIRSCSGQVQVDFSMLPAKGSFEFESALGDLDIFFAERSPRFRSQVLTSVHEIKRHGFEDDPEAEFFIKYKGYGHVQFKALKIPSLTPVL